MQSEGLGDPDNRERVVRDVCRRGRAARAVDAHAGGSA